MIANLTAVVWDGDDVLHVPDPFEFELVVPDPDRPVVLDGDGYEHEVSL